MPKHTRNMQISDNNAQACYKYAINIANNAKNMLCHAKNMITMLRKTLIIDASIFLKVIFKILTC